MKTVYLRFDVEAESYQEAEKKLEEAFHTVETVLENESVNEMPAILNTRKVTYTSKF